LTRLDGVGLGWRAVQGDIAAVKVFENSALQIKVEFCRVKLVPAQARNIHGQNAQA
jgi:hypothetical protein